MSCAFGELCLGRLWRAVHGLFSLKSSHLGHPSGLPSAREDGGISGVSSSCGSRLDFLPRHDEDLRHPQPEDLSSSFCDWLSSWGVRALPASLPTLINQGCALYIACVVYRRGEISLHSIKGFLTRTKLIFQRKNLPFLHLLCHIN